jgi:hypothetical protein
MTLEELLRSELHDFAERPLELPDDEDELRDELALADRRKLLQRAATAVFVLLFAVLIAVHLAPHAVHNGPVRIEHRPTTETTLPVPHDKNVVVPPATRSGSHASSAPKTGATKTPAPVAPGSRTGPVSQTPNTDPVVTPPNPQAPSSDFWAIASEAHDQKGNPTLIVFGEAPPGSDVTVSTSLGNHEYPINNQRDFRFTQQLSNNTSFPISVNVECGSGCGSASFNVAQNSSPSQPTPAGGFSVFGSQDDESGVFTIGGFAPMRGATSATVTSAYGNAQFDVVHGMYGGRVSFANAPLHTPFTVTVSSAGQTEQRTLVRN